MGVKNFCKVNITILKKFFFKVKINVLHEKNTREWHTKLVKV